MCVGCSSMQAVWCSAWGVYENWQAMVTYGSHRVGQLVSWGTVDHALCVVVMSCWKMPGGWLLTYILRAAHQAHAHSFIRLFAVW
jgi:hypothetical protein